MLLLIALGVWLVYSGPGTLQAREGAELYELRLPYGRGYIEASRRSNGEPVFRVLLREGHESPEMTAGEFEALFGPGHAEELLDRNPLFRLFNITTMGGVFWVGLGLIGQFIFAGRTIVQWVVSEHRGESVVPTIYWWMALGGAMLLFAYFIWRRDIVGVIGQASGIVIYVRNIRLIWRQGHADGPTTTGPASATPTGPASG